MQTTRKAADSSGSPHLDCTRRMVLTREPIESNETHDSRDEAIRSICMNHRLISARPL
jgi:hypothetical protein